MASDYLDVPIGNLSPDKQQMDTARRPRTHPRADSTFSQKRADVSRREKSVDRSRVEHTGDGFSEHGITQRENTSRLVKKKSRQKETVVGTRLFNSLFCIVFAIKATYVKNQLPCQLIFKVQKRKNYGKRVNLKRSHRSLHWITFVREHSLTEECQIRRKKKMARQVASLL